jgi:hypothetical protein
MHVARRAERRAELEAQRRAEVETEVRAALAEFAAAVEVRVHAELDRSRQTQASLIEALQTMRSEFATRDNHLAQALTAVANAVDQVAENIDADHLERRALIDAISTLARVGDQPLSLPPLEPRERVLGGTVFGGSSASGELEAGFGTNGGSNGDAENNGDAGQPVQVRIEGHWLDGFEVSEVVHDDEVLRYRVRRVSDAAILPQLFDAEQVRRIANPVRIERAPRPQTYWSRS